MANSTSGRHSCPAVASGAEMFEFAASTYPICRSITGDGVRLTLDAIARHVPLDRHEVASGTEVLDWTVPREWNIRASRIVNADGRAVPDIAHSSLHVVSYSVPVKGCFTFEERRPHLHTLRQTTDRIPYHTSYYAEDWSFCLSERQLEASGEGPFEVLIDSTLSSARATPAGSQLGELR